MFAQYQFDVNLECGELFHSSSHIRLHRSLAMDQPFLPRSAWTGDCKVLQHPADLCTGVVVTRGIPAGTCFGPCVLQHAFYDAVAFVAQKCYDRRAKSYAFRVSSAFRSSFIRH